MLAALQSEYTCTSSYAGFKLVIHENNIIPFPDAQGYNIGLGTVTLINIREVCQTYIVPRNFFTYACSGEIKQAWLSLRKLRFL